MGFKGKNGSQKGSQKRFFEGGFSRRWNALSGALLGCMLQTEKSWVHTKGVMHS